MKSKGKAAHHAHLPVSPVVRRHRRMFAVLRITEITLGVLGMMMALLALTAPTSPGHTTRELYFIAWSTPRLILAIAGALVGAAGLLQILSKPLKRRWAEHLRGWIT